MVFAAIQMVIIALLLGRRFAASRRDRQAMNTMLEQRVAQRSAELEDHFHRLGQLQIERALGAERRRLMRDVHDGIGGQLVQAIALSERAPAPKELREVLDAALADLRMIIESLAHDGDLETLLAVLRERLQSTLDHRGICLHWEVGDLPSSVLSAERTLSVLRLVQEAVTNVLRHSGAAHLSISARAEAGGTVRVAVCDDGDGFDAQRTEGAPGGGHGLANMRARAQQLHGTLQVTADAQGTRVVLRFPARPPAFSPNVHTAPSRQLPPDKGAAPSIPALQT